MVVNHDLVERTRKQCLVKIFCCVVEIYIVLNRFVDLYFKKRKCVLLERLEIFLRVFLILLYILLLLLFGNKNNLFWF